MDKWIVELTTDKGFDITVCYPPDRFFDFPSTKVAVSTVRSVSLLLDQHTVEVLVTNPEGRTSKQFLVTGPQGWYSKQH